MSDSKTVSIIMGIYNCEKTLPTAIESIINQTYTNWELIMCDDGSSDKTYEVANCYKEKYKSKIHLIRNKKNLRLSKTLNNCLKYAKGEYIARMDADDISLPQRLEKQVKFLENNKRYIVCGCAMIPFDDKEVYEPRIHSNCEDVNKKRSCFHATLLCRREMYDILGGYCTKWYANRCEDQYLWYSFSANKNLFAYNIEEPLYMVREDKNTFSRRNLKNAFTTSICLIHCYRLMHFSIFKYVNVLRPYVSAIMPYAIMKKYHDKNPNRKK